MPILTLHNQHTAACGTPPTFSNESGNLLRLRPGGRVVVPWEAHARNFAPNLGNDYGGRLMAAWLDR